MTTHIKQLHAVILDVDGTLIDSNDAQAHSWQNAMAEQGYPSSLRQNTTSYRYGW